MSSGEARVSARSDWSGPNLTFLSLITTGYVIGEIAHFLITTTSQAPGHQQQTPNLNELNSLCVNKAK